MTNLTCYITLIPFTHRKVYSKTQELCDLSNILDVRRQICEIFGVCSNEHHVKAPSILFKKSRVRLESYLMFNQQKIKKKEKNLRLMTAPVNNEECDTKLHCRLFDSMSGDAEMNVPPNMHTVIFA